MDENTYLVHECENSGQVKVTGEVIAIIAGLAATEVPGVESLANNITNEIVARLGGKNLAAGVNVKNVEGGVEVSLSLEIKMGCSIPEVSMEVQSGVKSAIEGMTGINVCGVNVNITNVKVDK